MFSVGEYMLGGNQKNRAACPYTRLVRRFGTRNVHSDVAHSRAFNSCSRDLLFLCTRIKLLLLTSQQAKIRPAMAVLIRASFCRSCSTYLRPMSIIQVRFLDMFRI